jgi:hypothetical protein
MEQVTLYYNADNLSLIFPATPVNRGIDEVLKRLDTLSRAGVQIVSTSELSDEDRSKLYFEWCWPSTKQHYRVAICFGRAGLSFGRGIPALTVREEDGMPKDVYPHENKDLPGQFITISDYFLHHGGIPQA